jgi:hypothetical protein
MGAGEVRSAGLFTLDFSQKALPPAFEFTRLICVWPVGGGPPPWKLINITHRRTCMYEHESVCLATLHGQGQGVA